VRRAAAESEPVGVWKRHRAPYCHCTLPRVTIVLVLAALVASATRMSGTGS
jgi:hypothetical protein